MLANEILDDPLRSKAQAFWSSFSCEKEVVQTTEAIRITGVVENLMLPNMQIMPYWFTPGRGFHPDDRARIFDVNFNRLTPSVQAICPGDIVTCLGDAKLKGSSLSFGEDVIICAWPQFLQDVAFNFVHWFSGGFLGWSRALTWLARNEPMCMIGQQISVDADPCAMQCWKQTTGKDFMVSPICNTCPMQVAKHVGVCGPVHDLTIARLVNFPNNLIETMSPPCVSWTRAGRERGLNCPESFAFFDALVQVSVTQPIMLFAECSEDTPRHKHFEFIQLTLSLLGYKNAWQQISSSHLLTHCMRTRWLAVWVRQDVPAQCIEAAFELKATQLTRWSDESNALYVPECLRKQLVIKPEILRYYADPDFLPPAKRMRTEDPNSVLTSRLVSVDNPLPTLCASYTSQHHLSHDWLKKKGIFSSLRIIDDEVAFLDPCLFICLLGSTSKTVIPARLEDAFHFLGNAICVPHALLTSVIGFSAILDLPWFPTRAVLKCWGERLQKHNTVVQVHGDYITVWPKDTFCNAPPVSIPPLVGNDGVHVSIAVHEQCAPAQGHLPPLLTEEELLCKVIGIPHHMLDQTVVFTEDHKSARSTTIARMAFLADEWQVRFVDRCIARVHLVNARHDKIAIPATMAYTIDDTPIASFCLPLPLQHDEFFDHPQLSTFLALLECGLKCPVVDDRITSILIFPNFPSINLKRNAWDFVNSGRSVVNALGFQLVKSMSLASHMQECVLVFPTTLSLADSAIVVLELLPNCLLVPLVLPMNIDADAVFVFGESTFHITHKNGNMVEASCLTLQSADTLTLRGHAIHAGGHPSALQQSITLRAGADFVERCEFAVNSCGWAADDEMQEILKAIQSSIHDPFHFEIMYWNSATHDIDYGLSDEPNFPEGCLTHLILLMDNHWVLCDVHKNSAAASVSTIGLRADISIAVAHAIARLIDIAPSKVSIRSDPQSVVPHMCGWQILHHLAQAVNFHPFESFAALPMPSEQRLRMIADVLQSSREEWTQAGASPDLCNFAHESRQFVFTKLATQVMTPPVEQIPLQFLATQALNQQVATQADPAQARLLQFSDQPAWMPSDLLDFAFDILRLRRPDVLFAPPCLWDEQAETFRAFQDLKPCWSGQTLAIVPIVWGTHWVHCEIASRSGCPWICIYAPIHYHQQSMPLLQALARWLHLDFLSCIVSYFVHFPSPDLCGWVLALSLFDRFGGDIPLPSQEQYTLITVHPHADIIAQIRSGLLQTMQQALCSPGFVTSAQSLLVLHINRILQGRITVDFAAAGAPEAKAAPSPAMPASASASVDPWLKKDPWSKSRGVTKWEDLQLTDDHHFVTGDEKLQQTHRLQLNPNVGGLILTTKAHVAELASTRCKKPCAAILPAIDSSTAKGAEIKSEGPYEVVLRDPATNATYKRLISLVVFQGPVDFKLHTPAYTMKTEEVSELVIEVDSRLAPKEEFEAAKAAPAVTIKRLFAELVPSCSASATFYSFRQNHHPSGGKNDLQVQCIVKVPTASRKILLEASGKSFLILRDFLAKGSQSDDTTVIPRFCNVSGKELRDLTITLQAVQGHAGVALTRRGLAARVWNTNISQARQALVPDDNRLCQENLHVIPKRTFEAAGWPAGATPQNVTAAIAKATSQPPIPMRTYRQGGVNIWVVAFEKDPSPRKFTVQFNSMLFEILITDAPVQQATKGTGKGKNKRQPLESVSVNNIPTILPSSDRQRLDALEAKFDNLGRHVSSLEDRQSSFESRLDTKFETINDSLRQLLQQAQPRARESLGETPPAKHPKN